MLPGGKNMQQLMKQAQKMQAEIMKQQEELANTVFFRFFGWRNGNC